MAPVTSIKVAPTNPNTKTANPKDDIDFDAEFKETERQKLAKK